MHGFNHELLDGRVLTIATISQINPEYMKTKYILHIWLKILSFVRSITFIYYRSAIYYYTTLLCVKVTIASCDIQNMSWTKIYRFKHF